MLDSGDADSGDWGGTGDEDLARRSRRESGRGLARPWYLGGVGCRCELSVDEIVLFGREGARVVQYELQTRGM